jgi:hypothetical protein
MAFEYEALVGHLTIVGGRAISQPPPGAYIEVAPKKAARGRETDTFFTLVLPSGDAVAPAAFYENMAALAAETYFNSSGSVTAGLRTVMNHLNTNLYDHNQRDPRKYEASILCAVLRGTDLIAARVGAGVGVLRHMGETQAFPAPFDDNADGLVDDIIYGVPLGVAPDPDIKMALYTVTGGTRLILADAALADLNYQTVTAALTEPDIGACLTALKNAAAAVKNLTLMLIECVPPDVPSPLPTREGASSVEALAAGKSTTEAPAAVAEAEAEAVPAPEAAAVGADETAARPGPRETRLRGPSSVELAAAGAAIGAARALRGAGDTLNRLAPAERPAGRGGAGSPIAVGIAVLIPILIVVGVVALWISGTGESEFDQCLREARTTAETARGVDSADVTGMIAAWNAVTLVINRCEGLRAGDPQLAALRREARSITDTLLGISRRRTTVIDTLPGAGLTHVVLQGEDLYVLDDTNDLVYRLTLSGDGFSVVPGTRQPIPSMRRSAQVEQFVVGDLIDIAWAENGAGLSQGNVIVALDRSGVLIDCPPRFLQNCNAQRINTDTWVNPVAIWFWQGRLYVLDPAANQIWRYDPSGGAYPNAPSEYFTGEGRPDIRGAVDFGIDTPGSIYILTEIGILARFTSARQDGFAFSGFPPNQRINRAVQFALNPNPPRQGMYFIDNSTRTIFETTMAGTFVNSYRPIDEEQFARIADVVVDTNKQILYVLSGPSIYAIDRTEGANP